MKHLENSVTLFFLKQLFNQVFLFCFLQVLVTDENIFFHFNYLFPDTLLTSLGEF